MDTKNQKNDGLNIENDGKFSFEVVKQSGLKRVGIIHTPHGDIKTPAFVGAATRATVKALTFKEMNELGSQAILANTYHLLLAPGPDLIEKAGGLSEFTGWRKPTFTDSGGFQILSLPSAKVDFGGVNFKSHINGAKLRMDPKISMEAQWKIGADIHMAFDCVADSRDHDIMEKAMNRTHEWLPLDISEHEKLAATALENHKPYQALYAVVQGGVFEDLRKESGEFMRDLRVDGYGIGWLYTTVDNTPEIIRLTNEILPQDKPKHLLGMGGEPRDLFWGAKYGCDTFDCVGPTRQARNGALYTKNGRINIHNAKFTEDFSPVDEGCECELCKNYTAAYLHHLFKVDEITAKVLASIHNEYFIVHTVDKIRESILDDTFDEYMADFLHKYYK